MDMGGIAAIVVLAAFLAVILRQQRPEQAMAVALIAGIGILALVLMRITPVISTLQELLGAADMPGEYGLILIKALGICLITQLASDACRDAGEAALASKADLAGKVTLLVLALPLFQKIGELAVSLINGQGAGG